MSDEKDILNIEQQRLAFSNLSESVRRFLFGIGQVKPFEPSTPLRILVVDDEEFVCEAVKLMFKFDGIIAHALSNGVEALRILEDQKYDLVITDFAMPYMKGDDLALAIKQRYPNQPVMMITAYAEMLLSSGDSLQGVDYILPKPFLLEDLRDATVRLLSARNEADAARSTLYQTHGAQLLLNSAANALGYILGSMRNPADVAESMIRHKAKNLVWSYLASLQNGTDLAESTKKFRDQLHSLLKFCVRLRLTQQKQPLDYLKQVLVDISKEHSGIIVEGHLGDNLRSIHANSGTVALLSMIVCELIDNAVESLNGKGEIRVEVDVLLSKQSFYIKVHDNGPGVQKGNEERIFKEHFSTKGSGRGLGLHLINEGVLKLGGRIEYTFENGAVFKAVMPLPLDCFTSPTAAPAKPSADGVHFGTHFKRPLKVVLSYAHKDEDLRERLEAHLTLLHRQGFISTWTDRRIVPGSNWAGIIDENFKSADLILLLISADFLASDYCHEIEMRTALEREAHGEAIVVPVFLRACDWQGAPFGKLQGLPRDAKPITSWTNRDEAWKDVAEGIKKLAQRFRK